MFFFFFLLFTHKRDPISSNLELIANVSEMDFPKKTKLLKRKITANICFSPHISCREEYSHHITRRSVRQNTKTKQDHAVSPFLPPPTPSILTSRPPSPSITHPALMITIIMLSRIAGALKSSRKKCTCLSTKQSDSI